MREKFFQAALIGRESSLVVMVYDYRYYRFYFDNKNSITISFSFHHFFRRGENKTEFRHAAPLRDVSFEASLNFLF